MAAYNFLDSARLVGGWEVPWFCVGVMLVLQVCSHELDSICSPVACQ
jgi:hypothetical protein